MISHDFYLRVAEQPKCHILLQPISELDVLVAGIGKYRTSLYAAHIHHKDQFIAQSSQTATCEIILNAHSSPGFDLEHTKNINLKSVTFYAWNYAVFQWREVNIINDWIHNFHQISFILRVFWWFSFVWCFLGPGVLISTFPSFLSLKESSVISTIWNIQWLLKFEKF